MVNKLWWCVSRFDTGTWQMDGHNCYISIAVLTRVKKWMSENIKKRWKTKLQLTIDKYTAELWSGAALGETGLRIAEVEEDSRGKAANESTHTSWYATTWMNLLTPAGMPGPRFAVKRLRKAVSNFLKLTCFCQSMTACPVLQSRIQQWAWARYCRSMPSAAYYFSISLLPQRSWWF